MPLKTVEKYADEVVKMGFAGIKKDNELFNAVSKGLAAGLCKDQFNYLNDKKRDAEHLYLKYIKPNDVNVSKALQAAAAASCTGPTADKAKAAKAIKDIDAEVNDLFNRNLKQNIIKHESFKVWVNKQNTPEAKKLAAKNAQVAGKKLGITNVVLLAKGMEAMMLDDKPTALAAFNKLAAEEKLKFKAEMIMKSLEAAGLA